jgi:hypothetical protein
MSHQGCDEGKAHRWTWQAVPNSLPWVGLPGPNQFNVTYLSVH